MLLLWANLFLVGSFTLNKNSGCSLLDKEISESREEPAFNELMRWCEVSASEERLARSSWSQLAFQTWPFFQTANLSYTETRSFQRTTTVACSKSPTKLTHVWLPISSHTATSRMQPISNPLLKEGGAPPKFDFTQKFRDFCKKYTLADWASKYEMKMQFFATTKQGEGGGELWWNLISECCS